MKTVISKDNAVSASIVAKIPLLSRGDVKVKTQSMFFDNLTLKRVVLFSFVISEVICDDARKQFRVFTWFKYFCFAVFNIIMLCCYIYFCCSVLKYLNFNLIDLMGMDAAILLN